MMCGCGIPEVTLLGTPDDWRSVRRRAQMLSEYDLTWWTDALLPVLDQLVASSEGRVDEKFWQSFFHHESGSMGSALNGWIHVLFPYITTYTSDWKKTFGRNPHMRNWSQDYNAGRSGGGPALTDVPSGLASAPVLVIDLRTGQRHDMRFIGGLFGVVEDDMGVLSTEFGWAIEHDEMK
jgi:hypothetical protein